MTYAQEGLAAAQQQVIDKIGEVVPDIMRQQYALNGAGISREALDDCELTSDVQRAMDETARAGFALMDRRYGTGWPSYQYDTVHGDRHLGYNNGGHQRAFAADGAVLANCMGYSRLQERIDTRLVAPWHDVVQDCVVRGLPRLGEDERDSAAALVDRLARQEAIAPRIAEIAAYGIMGTWVVTDTNGNVTGQWGAIAPDDYYPDVETKRAAQAAATNDLSRLYSAEGPYIGHILYAQRQGCAPHEVPPLDAFPAFAAAQVEFLDSHSYAIPEADRVFGRHRGEVVDYGRRVQQWAESGRVHEQGWGWLLEQDEDFARSLGATVLPSAILTA